MTTPESLAPAPVVTCKHCGRVAQCRRMKDGTVYRPFTWFFVDESDKGARVACQAILSRPALGAELPPEVEAARLPCPWSSVLRICAQSDALSYETCDMSPFATSAALAAQREYDATLRLLAQQECEDAADKPHEMILGQDLALVLESGTGLMFSEEIERQSRQLLAIVSGQGLIKPSPTAISPSYGSADAAPTNATFAPDFGDPDAIRIQREEGPVADLSRYRDGNRCLRYVVLDEIVPLGPDMVKL